VRERGIAGSELPARGALAVTVPGAAALWEDAVKAFGKLSLAQARPCARAQRPALGRTLE
jgi:gamma-glutamyltranspeptidase